MTLKFIGDVLIIKDGVLACKDGTPLKEYLADPRFHFKEGDPVNLIHRGDLVKLNGQAESLYLTMAC